MSTTGAGAEAEIDDGFERVFNSEAFSDRVLRIEVVGRDDDEPGSSVAAASGGSCAGRKRRREEDKGDDGEGIDSSCTELGTPVLRVRTIYVSSAILAAKSSFFFKLFSNGMKESGQRQATVRISDSDDACQMDIFSWITGFQIDYRKSMENAFMELLHFMYGGKLTPTDPTILVDILMVADKFEVVSCMKLCGQRLTDLPMTLESAVLCLDLPSSISVAADLAEEAKKFLAGRYKKFPSTELQDELMKIPLAGIVAILSRSDLGAASEEGIYDSVLRWADLQYPDSEERRQILGSHLLPLVTLMRGVNNVPIVLQPKCRINFALHRGHCSKLFPSGSKYRQKFSFAGHVYSLSAHRNMDSSNRFGLLLLMLDDKGPVEGTIDYKFEVQIRPLLQYVTKYECTSTDSREAAVCKDLFGVPWSEFIADGSPFFIDDVLHLQVRLNMTQKPL